MANPGMTFNLPLSLKKATVEGLTRRYRMSILQGIPFLRRGATMVFFEFPSHRTKGLFRNLLGGSLVSLSLLHPSPVEAQPFPVDRLQEMKNGIFTEEGVEALRGTADLAKALQLINQSGARIDPKLKQRLAERFEKSALDSLISPNQRWATLNLIGELAATERSASTRNVFLRTALANLASELAKSTNDPDPKIRSKAVRTLGNIDAEPAVTLAPIQKLLMTGSTVEERRAAAEGLGNLVRVPTPSDFDGEIKELENGNIVIRTGTYVSISEGQSLGVYAAGAIGQLIGRIRVKEIREKDKEKEAVCEALGQAAKDIKPGDRVSSRINYNTDVVSLAGKKLTANREPDPEVRRQTVAAFELTVAGVLALLREEGEREFTNLLPLFQAFRDNVIPLSKAAKDSDLLVRLTALQTLEEIGLIRERLKPAQGPARPDDPSYAPLKEVLSVLAHSVGDPNAEVRLISVQALERISDQLALETPGSEEAARALVRALGDKEMSAIRWVAARALGKMAPGYSNLALPPLAKALFDGDLDVKVAAAVAIRRYGETQGSRKTPISPSVLQTTVQSLAKATGQGRPYEFVDGVYGGDPEIRLNSVRALESFGMASKPAMGQLIASVNDPNTQVRLSAIQVLGQFGKEGKEASAVLTKALDDPESDVRRAAGEALLQIGK